MAMAETQQSRLAAWLKRGLILVWLALFATLPGLLEWRGSLVMDLVFSMLPALLLVGFMAGVAIWQLVRGLLALVRRQWAGFVLASVVLAAGPGLWFAGGFAADRLVVMMAGPALEAAIAGTERTEVFGHLPEAAGQVSFVTTDSLFFTLDALVYDGTGRFATEINLAPDQRSADFQAGLPWLLRCPGHSRHITGPYYKVTVGIEDCTETPLKAGEQAS